MRGRARVAGATLAYEQVGNGLPIVFVHPVTMDRRIWDRQISALAQHYEVMRYDLRGYGHSSAGPRTVRHAEDLAGLLDVLDFQGAGFSSDAGIKLANGRAFGREIDVSATTRIGGQTIQWWIAWA
jgi:pimeloyl-ACP methyl ester carboxylesterase